jgi:DsbC/DsbD-like thiol-disulfide interchange protein
MLFHLNRRILFAVLCLAAPALFAQTPDQIVHWSASIKPETVKPGGQPVAAVTAKIENGWHVYSITQAPGGPIKTSVRIPDGQDIRLAGAVKGTKPAVSFDKNFNMKTEYYQNAVSLTAPLAVDSKATPGTKKVKIDVRFQTCSDRLCLPPTTAHLQADATIKK